MCMVSMVYDHYEKRFPWGPGWPYSPSPGTGIPMPAPANPFAPQAQPIRDASEKAKELKRLKDLIKPEPSPEIEELRKLIAEFREAVAAAKKVDELTNQPDCFDPKKATLEERVSELERRLNTEAR
jgi:hypothetical protein